MSPPGAEALLRIWEEQYPAHPIQRALALLEAAWPEFGGAWALAPVGQRDAGLLRLYELLFGSGLQTVTHCPSCGERLESSFAAADLGAHTPEQLPGAVWHTLREGDFEIDFRLPSSEDLLTLRPVRSDAAARLLQRCIGRIGREGEKLPVTQVPARVLNRLRQEMAQRDPVADLRMALICPACAHEWEMGFDIVSYLWDELEDWAQRALAEVHLLASAYGWSERDILALSPTRRKCYLDMVQA